MRSPMQGLLVCLAACAAACSASHTDSEGALDSETHFLASCESTCPDDLACICGVCTAPCERDADCDELSGDATCQGPSGEAGDACLAGAPAAVCDATCSEDDDCRSIGADHQCEAGVCRPEVATVPPPPPPLATCGVEDAPVLGQAKSVAVATVLDDMRAAAVVGVDGGAAFIAADGRMMILRAGEDEPETIGQTDADWETKHVSLVSDGQTLFWSTATRPVQGFPGAEPPGPPSTIGRMNVDGSGHEVLVASDETVYESLTVDDERLYFTDPFQGGGLLTLAKDGGEPELLVDELQGSRLARSGGYFYWVSFGELKRADLETGDVETLLTAEQAPLLDSASALHANDSAILIVLPDPKAGEGVPDQTIARFDADNGCLIVFDLPETGINAELLLQGDYVFWKGFSHGPISPGEGDNSARLWRTDVTTGETVQLEPAGLDTTLTVDVLGHDADSIYVTQGTDLIRVSK